MRYGTCREFNDAFATVLLNWGYDRAAAYVNELKVSAHLLWTIDQKNFFAKMPGRISDKHRPQNITPEDRILLAEGFVQGLDGVIALAELERHDTKPYTHPREPPKIPRTNSYKVSDQVPREIYMNEQSLNEQLR